MSASEDFISTVVRIQQEVPIMMHAVLRKSLRVAAAAEVALHVEFLKMR
jgi:hypothetical protein